MWLVWFFGVGVAYVILLFGSEKRLFIVYKPLLSEEAVEEKRRGYTKATKKNVKKKKKSGVRNKDRGLVNGQKVTGQGVEKR